MSQPNQNRTKTIAIFTGYYLPHLGGIEVYTKGLATELNKMGYKVIIVTSNSDRLKSIERSESSVYRLPTYGLFRGRYPIIRKNQAYRQLIDDIMRQKIDSVICNTRFYHTTFIGLDIAKRQQAPVFLIEHASHHYSIGHKILDHLGALYEHILTSIVKRQVKNFYGVSEACNHWLKHFGIQSKGVFSNSIASEEYQSFHRRHFLSQKPKIVISYTGRILPEKGIEELLKAYHDIVTDFPDSLLAIAGDGPILANLKTKYQHPNIKFLGKLHHDQVMALYNDTDILVYPSKYPEGLPTTILEAGLMKCAIIATSAGGIAEVIDDPKYGLLTPGNSQDLAQQLRKLCNNPDLLLKLKENLHQKVLQQFTWHKTVRRVINEIKGIA